MSAELDDRHMLARHFADEWLDVAMNDYTAYTELMNDTCSMDNIQLAEKLRTDWENLAEQVTELIEEHISETASLFVGQWMKGQGVLPFDLIARAARAKYEEVSRYKEDYA